MNIVDGVLSWVERTVKWMRGGEPPRGKRHGKGEFVMSAGLLGGAHIGYPGGWSQDRVEQVFHLKHWVFVAIRAIMNEMSGLRPKVAFVHDTSRTLTRDLRIPGMRLKSMNQIQDHEHVEPCGPDHPLVKLFSCPNAWDTEGDLWAELTLFQELTGNSYLWTVPSDYGLRSGTYVPAELWVMPSHWVWPRLGPAGVRYYEVRPLIGPGTLHFPAEELLHVKQKSPIHKIDGFSTLQAGAEWADTDESINRSRFFQFKNGCFPTGAIELGEQYNDPDDQELERLYAKFFARLQGEDRFGRPIITPPGAKYNPLVINPTEMAYSQSADQLRDWILALFGVPKEVAGIQDAGSEIAIYGPLVQFMMRTIAPKLRHLGQVLTRFLASRYDERLRVWWDDPTPQSPETLSKELQQDATLGMITPAEYRAARGRRPYTPEEEEKYSQIGQKPPVSTGPGGMPGTPGMPPPGGEGANGQGPFGKRFADIPVPALTNGHHTKGEFREEDVKRDTGGQFSEQAGGGGTAPAPSAGTAGAGPESHSASEKAQARQQARAALDRRREAHARLTTDRQPGYTPADDQLLGDSRALGAAVEADSTSEKDQKAFREATGRHVRQTTALFIRLTSELFADVEAAGADPKALAKLIAAIDKGQAAIGKAGVKVEKAADRLTAAWQARPELPPEPEAPDPIEEQSDRVVFEEMHPDIPFDSVEGDSPEYEAALAEYEKRAAKVEKQNEKAQAAWEKADEKWQKLSERHDDAQSKIDDLGVAFDEAREAMNEVYSDASDRFGTLLNEIDASIADNLDATQQAIDDEEDQEEEPEEPEEDDEEDDEEDEPHTKAFREENVVRDRGRFSEKPGKEGAQAKKKRKARERDGRPAALPAKSLLARILSAVQDTAAGARAAASRLGKAVWDNLSPANQTRVARSWAAATAVYHAVEAPRHALEAMAVEVAKERGLPVKHAGKVGRVMAVASIVEQWVTNIPAAHHALEEAGLHGPAAFALAKVGALVPVSALAYLVYSTTRNPLAMIRAAQRVIAGKAAASHKMFSDDEDLAALLLERMGRGDWYEALLAAALDETQGDLAEAIALADEAWEEDGDQKSLHPLAPLVPVLTNALVALEIKAGATRRVGEVWQTASGRWYTRRQSDGRTVPAKGPDSGKGKEPKAGKDKPTKEKPPPKEKKPKKEPAAKKPKLTPENARAAISKMQAEGVSTQNIDLLAEQLMGLTVPELNALKKEMGFSASGNKAVLAERIADQAMRAGAAKPPAEKPAPAPAQSDEDFAAGMVDRLRRAQGGGGMHELPEDAVLGASPADQERLARGLGLPVDFPTDDRQLLADMLRAARDGKSPAQEWESSKEQIAEQRDEQEREGRWQRERDRVRARTEKEQATGRVETRPLSTVGTAADFRLSNNMEQALKDRRISESQRKSYRKSMEETLKRMPRGARDRVATYLDGGVKFAPDKHALVDDLVADLGEAIRRNVKVVDDIIDREAAKMPWPKRKEFLAKVRTPKGRADFEAEMAKAESAHFVGAKGKVGGCYIGGVKRTYLDGGYKKSGHAGPAEFSTSRGGEEAAQTGIYAHELTHAIDGPDSELSRSSLWQDAWRGEIATRDSALTSYASTSASEGIAEFGRLLYGGQVPLATVEARFPKASKFFRDHGLWPEG